VSDVVEDGATLEENARLKAVALVEATGEAAVADDTGLFVDALDGAPGVFTARFAGEGATYADNVAKMLAVLDGVPAARRGARFVTCALARWPDGRELSVEGVLPGRIALAARGTNGFGYDPIFLPDPPDGDGRTLAEMSTDEKNAVSHRARAFRALAARLVG
jgi:XTP/dITP diphosphohydrolase